MFFDKERAVAKAYKGDILQAEGIPLHLQNLLKGFVHAGWIRQGNEYHSNTIENSKARAIMPVLERLQIAVTWEEDWGSTGSEFDYGSKLDMRDFGQVLGYQASVKKDDYLKLKNLHFNF